MSVNVDAEVEKEAANTNARAFLKNIPRLQLGLSATIITVALHCYSQGLIPETVYAGMFKGQWSPDYVRAQYFLYCVLKRLRQYENSDPGAVKRTITTLASIVGRDSALEHIAKIIDGCSNAGDFQKKYASLSSGIEADLNSIAMGAAAKYIITFSDCQACTDGNANAEVNQTRMVLSEIFKEINRDPNVLDTFLAILDKIGAPISNYCQPIRDLMGEEETDHR